MCIPKGPYGKWVTQFLGNTVNGIARKVDVHFNRLRDVARGVPKVISAPRMQAVYREHHLTPRQFADNVKVGWHAKKAWRPGELPPTKPRATPVKQAKGKLWRR